MEGANGKILDTEDPRVVIKKIHRRHRAHHRAGSLNAAQQAAKQEDMRLLCERAAFKMLSVPRAWAAEHYQYKMDRISVDKPLELMDAKNHPVFEELKVFYAQCKGMGIFPADFELYVQPDGRIAMVDFDKFGEWKKAEIIFPWGQVADEAALLEPLALYPIQ